MHCCGSLQARGKALRKYAVKFRLLLTRTEKLRYGNSEALGEDT